MNLPPKNFLETDLQKHRKAAKLTLAGAILVGLSEVMKVAGIWERGFIPAWAGFAGVAFLFIVAARHFLIVRRLQKES